MCGIAGFIDARLSGKTPALMARARAMGDAIRHRGPDGDGYFIDERVGLAFSHRRLSIVDLSAAGQQPMTSTDGRWVICYNGEVYNAEELRATPALSRVRWRGHSDTEVILELTAALGVREMLTRANGMFAIALWDRVERTLHLARDRLGIKPLFVATGSYGLAFASEIKALRKMDSFVGEIDAQSVADFFRLGYVPAPHCIHRNVAKVLPGEWWSMAMGGDIATPSVEKRQYYSLHQVALDGLSNPLKIGDEEAIDALDQLLRSCVSTQMVSDVPVGALLSGGIDSSIVVAMMVAADRGPVHTFSIGFEEEEFDESAYAATVAAHLGSEHTKLTVTAADALAVIPKLPEMYDEPFADSSQIPTYLVSRLTRRHVTVALSGDGGDELFAGYNRHLMAATLMRRVEAMPLAIRKAASTLLKNVPHGFLQHGTSLLPRGLTLAQAGEKLRKLADVLPLREHEVYAKLVGLNRETKGLVANPIGHEGINWCSPSVAQLPDHLSKMQYLDMVGYLPDDILQKVDRASMAVALEVRPPLLDHRLVQFAWSLPPSQRVRNGRTKWLLRRVLERYVPPTLTDRPKMGFGVPLDAWLRGPLRDWAGDLLLSSRGASQWCKAGTLENMWRQHLSGSHNLASTIWPFVIFSAWAEHDWGNNPPSAQG